MNTEHSALRTEYEANLQLQPRDVLPGNQRHERIGSHVVRNCGGYENSSLRVVEYETLWEICHD